MQETFVVIESYRDLQLTGWLKGYNRFDPKEKIV
jgi:hypothetical protein